MGSSLSLKKTPKKQKKHCMICYLLVVSVGIRGRDWTKCFDWIKICVVQDESSLFLFIFLEEKNI